MNALVKVGRGLRFAWRYEIGLWAALGLWVARRPIAAEPGAKLFPYSSTVKMLMFVFIGVSAVEIPIVHLILPWPAARHVLDVIGVYGLLWMLGLWAGMVRNPHVAGPSGLRIRGGTTLDQPIAWTAIRQVRMRRRSMPPEGQVQVEEVGDQRILSFGVGSQTSIDVILHEPMTVPVRKAKGRPVTQIRFHADDPDALVAEANRWLAEHSRTV